MDWLKLWNEKIYPITLLKITDHHSPSNAIFDFIP